MVRSAAWLFVRRTLLYRPLLLGVAAVSTAMAVMTDLVMGPTFWTGMFTAVLLFALVVPVVAWRVQLRHVLVRYRQMEPAEAEFTFRGDGLLVRSNLGSAVMPWAGFKACWTGTGFWVLAFKAAGFVTLPIEALSPEVLALVRMNIPGK